LCAQLSGSSPEDRKRFHLDDRTPGDFALLKQSGCYTADGIDDVADYLATCKALSILGVSHATVERVWAVLAAILHLGEVRSAFSHNFFWKEKILIFFLLLFLLQVQFEADDNSFARVTDLNGPISYVTELLGVDTNALANALCTQTLVMRKETTTKALTPSQVSYYYYYYYYYYFSYVE
jgi:myosin heavy subunit